MAIKRKRSISTFSSPRSSSSSLSSSSYLSRDPSSSPITHNDHMDMMIDEEAHSNQFFMDITPLHLSSRTRKRFRNSRPAEHEVHEHTLNLLFKAQSHPQLENQNAVVPVPSEPMMRPSSSSHTRPMSAASQTSLHSFWALPTRPASAHAQVTLEIPTSIESPAHCEDCDASLPTADAADAMDVDGETGYNCRACSRQVCDTCAIAADDGRKCLQCHSGHGPGKRWVGGIGWI